VTRDMAYSFNRRRHWSDDLQPVQIRPGLYPDRGRKGSPICGSPNDVYDLAAFMSFPAGRRMSIAEFPFCQRCTERASHPSRGWAP
jgi:hypothetical protein